MAVHFTIYNKLTHCKVRIYIPVTGTEIDSKFAILHHSSSLFIFNRTVLNLLSGNYLLL